MVSIQQNTGMPRLPAERIIVRFLAVVEPISGLAGIRRHVRADKIGMRQDVLDFG